MISKDDDWKMNFRIRMLLKRYLYCNFLLHFITLRFYNNHNISIKKVLLMHMKMDP